MLKTCGRYLTAAAWEEGRICGVAVAEPGRHKTHARQHRKKGAKEIISIMANWQSGLSAGIKLAASGSQHQHLKRMFFAALGSSITLAY